MIFEKIVETWITQILIQANLFKILHVVIKLFLADNQF